MVAVLVLVVMDVVVLVSSGSVSKGAPFAGPRAQAAAPCAQAAAPRSCPLAFRCSSPNGYTEESLTRWRRARKETDAVEQAAAAAGLRDDVEARKIATLLSRGCTHVCSFAPAAAPRVGQLNIAPLREAVRTVTACGKYGCSAARGTYGCREAVSISRC